MGPQPRNPSVARLPRLLGLASACLLMGCTQWLFSGTPYPSNERPVMRIETRGGTEMGVGTEAGILFLGRTASDGPCRIAYWLGPTPMVEDGVVERWAGVFYRANMDLKHQRARFLDRDLAPDEPLVAMVYAGAQVEEFALQRVHEPTVQGDVVAWPGRDLPAGTGVFVREDDGLKFVGLIAGCIDIGSKRYLVHTGTTAMREAMLTAKPHTTPRQVRHRPDDITIEK